MKSIISLCLAILVLSCSNDKEEESLASENSFILEGSWVLTEQYADPGDGSGEFQKVQSNKTIQFFSNGSYNANGSLCILDLRDSPKTKGTYTIASPELTEYSTENFVTPDDCNEEKVFILFESNDLLLSYPCIEGCAQRYVRN